MHYWCRQLHAVRTNNTTSSTNSTTETTSSVVSQVTNPDYQKPKNISTAEDAKKALEAGNKAYKDGNIDITATNADRTDLSENGQKPYAVVITCSDSRVPPELIFNSGLGELFTIRTAGNVVEILKQAVLSMALTTLAHHW